MSQSGTPNHKWSARRAMASVYGLYAGLVGIEHGFFETRHGNLATGGSQILAVLPPGLPFPFGHEPAMTLIPNFLITGIFAMLFGLLVAIWSAGFVQKRGGGIVLLLLTVVLLLVGGGFAPISFLLVACLAGILLNSPLTRGRVHLAGSRLVGWLGRAWLWFFIITVLWVPVEFLLGVLFHLSLDQSPGFSFPIVVPLFFSLLCGLTHDLCLPGPMANR